MTDTAAPDTRRRHRRRRRRIAVWSILALAAALFFAGWWVSRPHRLTRIITGVLADAIHGQVELTEAHLVWTEGLYLTGLRIGVPGVDSGDVFAADKVFVNPSILSLFTGSLAADDIVLVRPTFYLTEDLDAGQYLFRRLAGDEQEPAAPSRVPRVTVREGRIIFREIEAGRAVDLGALELEGLLAADPGEADDYRFVLHEVKEGREGQATVRGEFSLLRQSFTVTMDGFRFEQPQRYFLRHDLRDWWDWLDPQGSFSTIELSYDPAAGWAAQLALDSASLNVPLGGYVPRMSDVTGRVRVEDFRVVLDELQGDLEGLRYRVSGEVADLRDMEKAAFTLHAETDWFNLEPRLDIIEKLPAQARKYYHRFQPAGRFQLNITSARDAVDGPVSFDGLLRLSDVTGVYHKFPYPARDVQGVVHFNHDGIDIQQLRGKGPGDMSFAFESGRIFPGDGAAVQVTVIIHNIAIDETFRAALEPEHLEAIDLFLDEARRRQLVDRGLLDGGWSLGGTVREARVTIDRPEGDKVKVDVTSVVDVAGLRMLYNHWPYPMTAQSGSLTIAPQRVEVDMTVAGPTGATGRIVGSLDRNGDQDLFPDLRIEDAVIPVDGLLVQSLPKPQDQWVADLNVTGELRGNGRIYQQRGDTTRFELLANLTAGRATPHRGDFTLDPVEGSFLIERSRFTIRSLTGSRGDARLNLVGALDWADGPLALNLNIRAADLPIESAVLDLIPHALEQRDLIRDLFDKYQPTGVLNASIDFQSEQQDRYTLVLEPRTLGLRLPTGGVMFEEITGRAVVEPGRVRLEKFTANFDDTARLAADGRVALDPGAARDVALSVSSQGIGPTLAALLPPAVTAMAESLQLEGRFNLTDATLLRDRAGTTFDGDLALTDAAMTIGIEVDDLAGTMHLHSAQARDQARPRLELELHADSLRAADRLVTNLDMTMASSDDGRSLRIERFLGSIYGGSLIGRGAVTLTDQPRYAFDVTIGDAALGPFLRPLEHDDTFQLAPQRQTPTSGLISANLAVEARADDTATRIGRGAIEVRDARLYNQPLSLAILQTLNLTLPIDRSFHAASARYLVDGDTVLLDTIRFEAPSLVISGAGTLDWPTQKLDLQMVTRNPAMPNLGTMGEVINKLKDELIAIHITGSLAEPVGRAVSLTGIRRSWDLLFSTRAAAATRADEADAPP